MQDEVSGAVIIISKFNVESNDVDEFLKIWEEMPLTSNGKPGFILAKII